jgi:homoserine O-acetyltransferase/O-succinyltransferase
MKKFVLITLFTLNALAGLAQNKGVRGDPDDDIQQQFANLGDFKLQSGEVIQDCRIGYRIYGHFNATKTNGVLFPSWFGGTARDIEQYATPWKVVDTNRYVLIIVDALGDGVSSSPSNSVRQHGPNFPAFSIVDMVESQHRLLTRKLGIGRLHAIMGISMGGMQAFQWAVSYPGFAARIIPIVGSPRLSSYDLMGYSIFRKIIEADTAFNNGNYSVNPVIAPAAMLIEFAITTPAFKVKTMSRDSFAVWQKQLETANGPDWNDTYYQLLAITGHDISKPYNGSLKESAKHVRAKMLIIVSQQDHMVNPLPAIEFSKLLPAKLVILDSDLGHEAPNFDDQVMQKNIIEILRDDKQL